MANMTPETARLLAQALLIRREAERGMLTLLSRREVETPEAIAQAMTLLADSYVHEQRIINRILSEDEDE